MELRKRYSMTRHPRRLGERPMFVAIFYAFFLGFAAGAYAVAIGCLR